MSFMVETPFSVSASAAKRIQEITAGRPDQALRVEVKGGGCSGFQYEFAITSTLTTEDKIFEQDGAKVYVDDVSLNYMAGSVLDFEDGLMGQAFKVRNPLAKSSCGCGTSFSL